MSRVLLLIFGLLIIVFVIYKYYRKLVITNPKEFKVRLFSAIIILCSVYVLLYSNIVNVLYSEIRYGKAIEELKETLPEDKIKVGSTGVPELLIQGKWVSVEDIDVLSPLFKEKITITYDGKEIEVMDSPTVNALKILADYGIIPSTDY